MKQLATGKWLAPETLTFLFRSKQSPEIEKSDRNSVIVSCGTVNSNGRLAGHSKMQF